MDVDVIGGTLRRAWPELAGDPLRLKEYRDAVEGLDPDLVRDVASRMAAGGGPPPAPAALRAAVLARQRSAPRAIALAPGIHEAARRPVLVLLAVAGLAGPVAALAADRPWLRLSWPDSAVLVGAGDIPGASILRTAEAVAMVVALAAMVWIVRRGEGGALPTLAFAALALLHGAALAGALRAYIWMTQTAGIAGRTVEHGVTTAYWQGVALVAAGLVASLWGLGRVDRARSATRGAGAAAGGAAGRPA